MNILQVCNKVPYPAIDGGAIATLNLSRGLAMNGHKLTVLAMNTLKHRVDENLLPEELKAQLDFELVTVDAPISAKGAFLNYIFSRKPYTASRFISANFEESLVKLIAKDRYDIIQLEGLYLTMYIDVIRRHTKASIVLRAHNIEHEIWQRVMQQEPNMLKRLYLKSLVKRIARMEQEIVNKYDILVPITARDGEVFQKMGNTKPLHVCQTGIFTNEYSALQKSSTLSHIVHIGALDWAPNQEGLIWFVENVWPEILKEQPAVEFHVAGRNAPEWLVKKFLGIKQLKYFGEVNDAHEFITKGQIMIVPLLSGSGMRIKIIEGMALARCIVSTAIGIEGISASHNQHVLIANAPQEFANEILLCINEADKAKRIGAAARNFIELNFDNQGIAGNLADFYQANLVNGEIVE